MQICRFKIIIYFTKYSTPFRDIRFVNVINVCQGNHVNTTQLKEVGSSLCVAIACLRDETQWREQAVQQCGLSSVTNDLTGSVSINPS